MHLQDSGAIFSDCKKYRFKLWRIWDNQLPRILFIGLNPSTACTKLNDATTKKIITLSKNWGFGGMYLLNCFPLIATNPRELNQFDRIEENDAYFKKLTKENLEVVFAWGNFKEVVEKKRDVMLLQLFPNAKVIAFNKNGSPKHPLYTKSDSKPVLYTKSS